jgi:hypothetical protein
LHLVGILFPHMGYPLLTLETKVLTNTMLPSLLYFNILIWKIEL